MSYHVHVPLGKPVAFPNVCPFSEKPSPSSRIRLGHTSTSSVLPLPGGFLNSYSSTTIEIPVSGEIARRAQILQILIWLSILGGMATCVWAISFDHSQLSRYAPVVLVGALIVALAFRILRYFVLRKVLVKGVWNGFVKVRFQSESYAKEFSELNRLALVKD